MIDVSNLVVRASCLYPLGDRTVIQVTGRDRAVFLHNFCTNDVRSLQPGDGCEAFVTDVKGHVLGLVLLLARAEEILVWTVAGQAEALISHWDRYCIREQVTFLDQSGQWTSYCVQCRDTDDRFAERASQRLSHLDVESEGPRMLLVRGLLDDLTTWLCLVPSESADTLLGICQRVGTPVGPWTDFDALRVARGIPEFGRDVSTENLPQEVNRDRQAIHFRKGCYLGQETVARIDALGHVNRMFVRLQFPEGRLPEPGTLLTASDVDRTVGQITSVGRHGEDAVGLAYVRREHATEGTVLHCPAGPAMIVSPSPTHGSDVH